MPSAVPARRPARLVAAVLAVTALLAGCARPAAGPRGTLRIVAAENTWGALAAELAGPSASVSSILTDPNADPHEVEGKLSQLRAVGSADLFIVNGAGYDGWAQQMAAATSGGSRRVLDVGRLLGARVGDNPHFWYSPADVGRVAAEITRLLVAAAPGRAGSLDANLASVERRIDTWRSSLAAVGAAHPGVAVGATESIAVDWCEAAGLRLVSPPAFMQAISEGNEAPPSAVAEMFDQIAAHRIAALIVNVQTETAVTSHLVRSADAAGVPVVAISETISPPTLGFFAWQQLQQDRLAAALGPAGRGSTP